jgi:excisionase family DNA binding protein
VQLREELSVPQVATYLKVNEETVRRNIRSKRLPAIRHGTQWFVSRDDLLVFASSYDPKSGQVKHML